MILMMNVILAYNAVVCLEIIDIRLEAFWGKSLIFSGFGSRDWLAVNFCVLFGGGWKLGLGWVDMLIFMILPDL